MSAREALDQIAQRAEAATEGPWIVASGRGIHSRVYQREDQREVQDEHERRIAHYVEPPDAEFIASSRTDVPRMEKALRAVLDLADEIEQAGNYAEGIGYRPPGRDTVYAAERLRDVIEQHLTNGDDDE